MCVVPLIDKPCADYKIFKKVYFKWFKLIHAIPKSWKRDIKTEQGNWRNFLYLNHQKQPNLLH